MTKNRVSSNAADAPAHTLVFKICDRAAWEEASMSGLYHGSPDDARDGYIHFSTPQQLAATAAKHFRHVPNLVLVAVDPSYFRPSEVEALVGDASKARAGLGWAPATAFKALVELMVDADLALARSGP